MAGGGDAGVFEQAGFSTGHAVDSAAEHGLDGQVTVGCVSAFGRAEGALDGDDVGDVGFVGFHPAVNGGCQFIEVLNNEGSPGVVAVGANAVESEDECVAEFVDMAAKPEGGGVGEMGSGDELGGDGVRAEEAQGAGDGAVGTDQDARVVEAERAQDVHGVGVAAAGGDDDHDAGGVGGEEGGEVARADATVFAEQSAVHVDGDHADGVLQLSPDSVNSNSKWLRDFSTQRGGCRCWIGFVIALCSCGRVKISLGVGVAAGPGLEAEIKPEDAARCGRHIWHGTCTWYGGEVLLCDAWFIYENRLITRVCISCCGFFRRIR